LKSNCINHSPNYSATAIAFALIHPHHGQPVVISSSTGTLFSHCGQFSFATVASFHAGVSRFVPPGNSRPYFAAV